MIIIKIVQHHKLKLENSIGTVEVYVVIEG